MATGQNPPIEGSDKYVSIVRARRVIQEAKPDALVLGTRRLLAETRGRMKERRTKAAGQLRA
jgi:hypothetical protein